MFTSLIEKVRNRNIYGYIQVYRQRYIILQFNQFSNRCSNKVLLCIKQYQYMYIM